MLKVPIDVHLEIDQFLSCEARILDENRISEWLDLLEDDLYYSMPVRSATHGLPERTGMDFALFDDDKASIKLRAARMRSGVAPTETPPSLVQRMITNVEVEPTAAADEYSVRSKFLIHQERRGRHVSMLVGARIDVLRRTAAGWRIARREIRLAQTLLPTTIAIFL